MRITKKLKEKILDNANYECEYCGVKLNEYNSTIDHKIPLSKGGTNEVSNLAAACTKCNMLKANKILDSIANPIVKQAAETWIHLFIKSPKVTSVTSILISLIMAIFVYYSSVLETEKRQKELSKNLNFKTQIEQLDLTEKNLKQLLNFINSQKIQMANTEESINSLKKEQENLQPLIKADRKTVEAIFTAQKIRAEKNASREHWIGFAMGIGASLVASILWYIFQYFVLRAKEES